MTSKYDPRRGRWTLMRKIKVYLEKTPGPVTEDQLLQHLKLIGYYSPTTREILRSLVDVDEDGFCRLARGE